MGWILFGVTVFILFHGTLILWFYILGRLNPSTHSLEPSPIDQAMLAGEITAEEWDAARKRAKASVEK